MCNWLYPELFVKETQQYWRDAFSLSDGTVDSTFLEDVREFLGVIMLRRLKQSTSAGLEIPAKKEVILHLPLTQEQKRLYLEVITGCVDFVEDSANDDSSYALQTPPASPGSEGFTRSHSTNQNARGKRSGLSVTNTLMELRKVGQPHSVPGSFGIPILTLDQVCIHPLLVDNMEKGDDDDEAMIRGLVDFSSKFIALERLVDQEVVRNNKKMLIFSGFDYALDCCQSLLSAMNISHLRLDGSTPHAMRRFAVHQFQKKDEHRVFVIATKAGGEGITLTAAEVVVFLDLDWNPQVMAQAEARAHRIGQERPVTVVKLCTRGTVEHQMLNRVNKKLYLASKVINDVAAGNSEISISEPFESDDTFIHRLISHSFTPKPVDSFTADQLIKMDWGEIVKSCQHTSDADDHEHTSPVTTPPSPGVDTFDEQEKLWLSQSTKIRTGLFNGTIFSRPRAALKVDILADLDPSKRRLGKNRRVYDPEIGYYVDKMSTLCKYGEAVSPMTKVKTSKLKTVFTNGFEHLKVSQLTSICCFS
jgi:SWI/SNF-related matrix-associated actin-dependent regulator of chromatin subfamily A member 5